MMDFQKTNPTLLISPEKLSRLYDLLNSQDPTLITLPDSQGTFGVRSLDKREGTIHCHFSDDNSFFSLKISESNVELLTSYPSFTDLSIGARIVESVLDTSKLGTPFGEAEALKYFSNLDRIDFFMKVKFESGKRLLLDRILDVTEDPLEQPNETERISIIKLLHEREIEVTEREVEERGKRKIEESDGNVDLSISIQFDNSQVLIAVLAYRISVDSSLFSPQIDLSSFPIEIENLDTGEKLILRGNPSAPVFIEASRGNIFKVSIRE